MKTGKKRRRWRRQNRWRRRRNVVKNGLMGSMWAVNIKPLCRRQKMLLIFSISSSSPSSIFWSKVSKEEEKPCFCYCFISIFWTVFFVISYPLLFDHLTNESLWSSSSLWTMLSLLEMVVLLFVWNAFVDLLIFVFYSPVIFFSAVRREGSLRDRGTKEGSGNFFWFSK